LLQWTIFSSLFMRDLTLHNATSFGKVSYQYDYLLTSYVYKDYIQLESFVEINASFYGPYKRYSPKLLG